MHIRVGDDYNIYNRSYRTNLFILEGVARVKTIHACSATGASCSVFFLTMGTVSSDAFFRKVTFRGQGCDGDEYAARMQKAEKGS